jgi:hypothetical protein
VLPAGEGPVEAAAGTSAVPAALPPLTTVAVDAQPASKRSRRSTYAAPGHRDVAEPGGSPEGLGRSKSQRAAASNARQIFQHLDEDSEGDPVQATEVAASSEDMLVEPAQGGGATAAAAAVDGDVGQAQREPKRGKGRKAAGHGASGEPAAGAVSAAAVQEGLAFVDEDVCNPEEHRYCEKLQVRSWHVSDAVQSMYPAHACRTVHHDKHSQNSGMAAAETIGCVHVCGRQLLQGGITHSGDNLPNDHTACCCRESSSS